MIWIHFKWYVITGRPREPFHLVAKCLKTTWTKTQCLTCLVVDKQNPSSTFLKLERSLPEIGLKYVLFPKFIVSIVAVYIWIQYSICFCAFQKYCHQGKRCFFFKYFYKACECPVFIRTLQNSVKVFEKSFLEAWI